MIETLAEPRHLPVQRLLSGVRERRVPNIVRQSQRLGQVLVQFQCMSQRARNLRHFDGMGKPVAKMIRKSRREYLRLGLQTPESTGVDYPIAIALKLVAVSVRRFRIPPAPTL